MSAVIQDLASLRFARAVKDLKATVPFIGGYFTELEIKQIQSVLSDYPRHARIVDLHLSYKHLDPDIYVSRLALLSPNQKITQSIHKVTNMQAGLLEVPTHYYLGEGPDSQCFEGFQNFYRLIIALNDDLKRKIAAAPMPGLRAP